MRKSATCGSDSGYYRHLRTTHTPPCDACLAAHAAAVAGRPGTAPPVRTCRVCEAEFHPRGTDVTCGPECSAINRRRRRREGRRAAPPEPTPLTGGRWVPRRGIKVWEAA